MMPTPDILLEIAVAGVVIPWVTWVTVSIFNQRQELVLLKQTYSDLKNSVDRLITVFEKKNSNSRKIKIN